MAMTVDYQGYTIQSAPRFQADWLKWQLHIVISVQDHRGIQTREFSADILYVTMQEADGQGIAFGQRIIDGKVEGRSVMDMKRADRRATPRLRVQFRTTFSASSKLEGTGVMLDLSRGGCRVESSVLVQLSVALELRIYLPDLAWPLMVEEASVQWVSGQMFGLAFVRISQTEQQRLDQVLTVLREHGEENDAR